MPELNRIIETTLYVDDLERARQFYSEVLGLGSILETDTLIAYDIAQQNVLLIFKRGSALETQTLPGKSGSQGIIPSHDGSGPLHICFAIDEDELNAWEARLQRNEIPIEGRTRWARGGKSIYFRDPDDHLLELMTPGNWPVY